MSLIEFLLAGITEDERLLDDEDRVYGGMGEVWTIEAHDRVLAECEAKRRIVENLIACQEKYDATPNAYSAGARDSYLFAVKLHAVAYADQPGYRDEWRP